MARPWACDPSRWQREARGQSLEVHPAHPAAFLAAPPEATEPDTADLLTEPVECRVVVRPAVVAVVTRQHAGVPAMLRGHWGVHQPPGFLAQRLQLARQTLALSLVLYDEPAVPCPPAVVGEAEEGEAHRSPLAALPSSQSREPAELDQSRLVLVQRQAEMAQSLIEGAEHLPCIGLGLEAHHEVVGIAHDHNATASMSPTPLVDPEVEDVVQEDIGEERADACPLRRSSVRFVPLVALQDTGAQPELDEP